MYTNPIIWLVSIFFMIVFSFSAGVIISNKKIPYGRRLYFMAGLGLLSFLPLIVLDQATTSSIEEIVNETKQKTISYHDSDELLNGRFKLSSGWYQVAEIPVITRLFLKSGDTTKYVVLTVHTDCVGSLRIAFPENDWKIPLPEEREKYLGEKWASVSSSYSNLKTVRIERYGVKEFGFGSRIVDAKFN